MRNRQEGGIACWPCVPMPESKKNSICGMGWCLSRSERQQQIVFIERKGVSRKEGAYTHGIICCKKPFEKQLRSWVEETSVKHAARPPLVLQGRGGNRKGYTSSVGHSILSEWQGNVCTLKKIQHLVSLGGKIFFPPCERAWVYFYTFQEDKSMFIDQSKSKSVVFKNMGIYWQFCLLGSRHFGFFSWACFFC